MTKQTHREIIAKLAKAHDAKAKDAEYSEQARSALIAKAKKARQDFEREARELGGPFSGPGVWNDVRKALEGK